MKKNILVVQSLLVLPLITSSITLSMSKEQQPSMTEQEIQKLQSAIKGSHCPLMAELIKHFENDTIKLRTTPSKQTAEETTPSTNLMVSEIEVVDLTLPIKIVTTETTSTNVAQEKAPEINLLEQSVMLPTEKKELSFLEKLAYYTSTSSKILTNIIQQLEDKTFDAKDLNAFFRLEEAVITATQNNDATSLIKIAILCEDNYPQTIRIADHVAEPASKVVESYYMSKLNLTNETIQNKRQEKVQQWNTAKCLTVKTILEATSAYNQSTTTLDNTYNNSVEQEAAQIEALRKELQAFSKLNKNIRGYLTKLLINNKVKQPKVILDVTINSATKELNSIVRELDRIPSIQGFEAKKAITAALDEKK